MVRNGASNGRVTGVPITIVFIRCSDISITRGGEPNDRPSAAPCLIGHAGYQASDISTTTKN